MKNAIPIAAVAGLASAAAAQTLELTPSSSTVNTSGGATFTIALSAVDFESLGANILNSDGISLRNNGPAGLIAQADGSETAVDVTYTVDPLFDGSPVFPPVFGWDPATQEFEGTSWGWNPFAGPPADSGGNSVATANDPLLGFYTVSVADGAVGTLDFSQFQRDPNTFLISTTTTGFDITEYQASDVTFGTATVNLVPAPSALALVGLGGLVAGRRRR